MHTFHLLPIPFLQQIQRLKILRMNQQPIALLIKILNRRQQSILEAVIKKLRIQNQLVIRLEKIRRQRLSITRIFQIFLDFIDGKQLNPFIVLRLIRYNLRVQRLRHAIQRDAVLRLHHKLLFQP